MKTYIDVQYNNQNYTIPVNAKIQDLFNFGGFNNLPLVEWFKLLELKDGKCTLDILKQVAIHLVKIYDVTTKEFIVNNKSEWLDKSTREGIRNLLACSDKSIQIILKHNSLHLFKNQATKFLNDIELYSYECFLTTNVHIKNIKKAKTIEELLNYDFKQGYPKKLIINV